jgi:hypothetical protein
VGQIGQFKCNGEIKYIYINFQLFSLKKEANWKIYVTMKYERRCEELDIQTYYFSCLPLSEIEILLSP